MFKHNRLVCIALASSALAVGCNRSDDTEKAQVAQSVSLTGCVSSGMGNQQYMLTQVRFEQGADKNTYAGTGLTEHSQVRLSVADESQVSQLVGQVASITGSLKDDGRNTIGTSGPAAGPNDPEPRTAQSEAASTDKHSEKVAKEAGPIGQRSMNNGNFPEVKVDRITATGQKCQTLPVEDRR
jgi:hypothetical protein